MNNNHQFIEYVKKTMDFDSVEDYTKVIGKEIKHIDEFGQVQWTKTVLMPLVDKDDKTTSEVVVKFDITEKKMFENLSITDGLTQLYNRRHFNEVLKREINRTLREKTVLSFLILDVDYFKKYNDAYGHDAGDKALVAVANSIKSSIKRGGDFAFRLGGEEFGVLISGNNVNDSLVVAERIREDIEKLNILHSNSEISNTMTVSIGLLVVDFKEESVDDHGFYTMADDALYQAKNMGRNRVVVYENEDLEFF